MSTVIVKSPLRISAWQVFVVFLKLGLTSFGGPIAHLGYFRDEFVSKRNWLSDESYADLVALCQFLPGPASSQVGIAIGLSQAGYKGALGAWLGFTLPSAVALTLFALGLTNYKEFIDDGMLHGLKIVAVAIVAQAIWGMAKSLCPDIKRLTIMAIAACFVLLIPSTFGQIVAIILGGIVGLVLFKPVVINSYSSLDMLISPRAGFLWLLLFAFLFILLPIMASIFPSSTLGMIDLFYRTGSLVFGGGHVVLPLLQTEIVAAGMIDNNVLLSGYGATQAVPGPLFTLAAFLGASMDEAPNSWTGATIALVAIFLPSFLLIMGVLPFWEKLRHHLLTRAALMGINATVVGILIAAFYQPIWTSAIFEAKDFALALVAFVVLNFWNTPPWIVVIICGFMGWFLHSSYIPFYN